MLLRSRRINNAVNSSSPSPTRANKKVSVLPKKRISKLTTQKQPTKIVQNLRPRKCSPLVKQTPTVVSRPSKGPIIAHNTKKITKTTPTTTAATTAPPKEHVDYSNSILMSPPSLENYNISIPLGSEHYDVFSNFFSSCVQCDEEFLCHIKLKFLLGNPSATNNTLSQELSANIAKECINYVRLRVSEGNCDHGQGDAGTSSMESNGFLESLVKVEISVNEFDGMTNDASEKVKSETMNDVKIYDPQQVNEEEDDEQLLLPNPLFKCSNVQPLPSEPFQEVEDVQIIGIGRAVGMVMTFKFSNPSTPMPTHPESRSNPPAKQVSSSSSRIIIRRPGRRQLPPQPLYVPQVINGVNVAAFQSKLNNLRMCGICNYPANGMVDLNMHQRIAHSLYKGKVAGLPIAK